MSDHTQTYIPEELLPDPLPETPFPIITRWYDQAIQRQDQPNPNSVTLATIDPDGRPSARIVLCKHIEPDPGCFLFYTNRRSRKGRALEANPVAVIVFHWDHAERQIRVEGPVTHTTDEESDAYFATRAIESRIGAWASDQSEPLESREDLILKVGQTIADLGIQFDDPNAVIPRPPHWGGYRLWARRIECWLAAPGRVHDRARWQRTLTPNADNTYAATPWEATLLQP